MARKAKDTALVDLQAAQQSLLEIALRIRMTQGTSDTWKHTMRAAQHCTVALLHALDPDGKQVQQEIEKFTILKTDGDRNGAAGLQPNPPPLVKRA